MGLKLENTFRQHVELPVVSESREEYVAGNLFQEGDEVVIKETNEVGTISVCGTNYVIVEGVLGKKRYWLDAIELLEYNEIGTKKYTDYIKGETPGEKKKKKDENREDPDIGHRKGSQPAKYHTGLSKSTKQKRDAHFKKKSTKPAPGDATAKTKPSTHTKKFKQMFGESLLLSFEDYNIEEGKSDAALKKKADKSGRPLGILRQVFNRGVAAWKTGHRPGTTAVQWGLARVNSFVTKSKGTWGKADADLAKKVRGS